MIAVLTTLQAARWSHTCLAAAELAETISSDDDDLQRLANELREMSEWLEERQDSGVLS